MIRTPHLLTRRAQRRAAPQPARIPLGDRSPSTSNEGQA